VLRVSGFGIERMARATLAGGRPDDALPGLIGSPPLAVVAAFDQDRRLELDIDRQRWTLASAVVPRAIRVISDGRTVRVLPGVAASDDDPIAMQAVLSIAGRELELPAVATRDGRRLKVAIDASSVEPLDGPAALGLALDGPGQPRLDLGPVTPGRGRITFATIWPESLRDRVAPSIRKRVRRAYLALPEPARRLARRAGRVVRTITGRGRGPRRRRSP
jgi:hypothetical protein